MSTLASFFRLARMRRSAGATRMQALRWAAGLLWRDFRTSFVSSFERLTNEPDPHRRERLDRRSDVERRARQRL